MPTEDIQRITNNLAGRATMRGGADWYLALWDLLEAHGCELRADDRLLDVGAGWGRMLRFLLRDVPVERLAGVDVDRRLVEACRAHLPGGTYSAVKPRGSLPFEDGAFSVVVNNSLFSHLSAAQHLHTLGEIARVTRPGGLVVSTILSRRHLLRHRIDDPDPGLPWSGIADPRDALARFDAGELVFHQTRRGRMADYGLALIPDAWLYENWRGSLHILAIDHECAGQSLVLARRDVAASSAAQST